MTTIYTVRLQMWSPNAAALAARKVGANLLDITVGSGGTDGAPFAPLERAKDEALESRKFAQKLRARDPHKADRVEAAAWATYCEAFAVQMANSQAENPEVWNRRRWGSDLALGCYCGEWTMGTGAKVLHCHRVLVADIFAALGCKLGGELSL